MIERVEKVSRAKKTKFNSEELFKRKKGFDNNDKEPSFADIMQQNKPVVKKNSDVTDKPVINKAYQLEVGRPTQSLFYQGKVDLREVQAKIYKNF